MKLRFWGGHGSIPVPGKDTLEFGGNTSCYSFDPGNEDEVVRGMEEEANQASISIPTSQSLLSR